MGFLTRRLELSKLLLHKLNKSNFNEGNSFVITGMPRSGTMFIAKMLDKSNQFKVTHDLHVPLGHKYLDNNSNVYLYLLNKFLSTNYYGDVSGVHRSYLDKLEVDKKVIIIRDPLKVLKSYLNMGEENYYQTVGWLKDGTFTKEFYGLIDLIEDGVPYFKFEQLVNDSSYFIDLALSVGISDLNESQIDLNKKINKRRKKYTLKSLDQSLLRSFKKSMVDFREYFGYS